MRNPRALSFTALLIMSMSCRQVLGIEDAQLICPPELPVCKICQDVNDCGPASECNTWSCQNNLCTPINKPARTPCSRGVCSNDPLSTCETCVEDGDCPSGGHCGREHLCFRCDDGVQNGREHGVDCGGPCKSCTGEKCASDDECLSSFCTDGTCCGTRCDITCSTCNNPQGDCTNLPRYTRDDNPVCGFQDVCDGFGTCLLQPGEQCTAVVECASYRCYKFRCAKLPGETCFDPLECAEMSCVDGKCQQ